MQLAQEFCALFLRAEERGVTLTLRRHDESLDQLNLTVVHSPGHIVRARGESFRILLTGRRASLGLGVDGNLFFDLLECAKKEHPAGGAGGGFDAWLGVVQVVTVAVDALQRPERKADVEDLELSGICHRLASSRWESTAAVFASAAWPSG